MRYDGYESAVIGQRAFIPSHASIDVATKYAIGGLFARVVDLPSEKAVERGIITDHATRKELGRLNAYAVLADALRWSHLYGGGAILLITDDDYLNSPLNLARVKKVEELRAIALVDITAEPTKYTDRFDEKYGLPTHYSINNNGTPLIVHESRIIPISGDPLPASHKRTSIPWEGRSGVLRTYAAIENYVEAQALMMNILRRKQQAVYSMQGLADALQMGHENLVQARVGHVDAARGVLNTVVVDTTDTYDIKDMNLGGLPQVLQEAQIAISAEAGIPLTLLMGRSPAGMNATGESDFEAFYDTVRGDQRTKLTPALRRILEAIYAQPSVDSPNHWQKISWAPLYSPTESQQADTAKTKAETLQTAVNALTSAMEHGLISLEQAKDYLDFDVMIEEEDSE